MLIQALNVFLFGARVSHTMRDTFWLVSAYESCVICFSVHPNRKSIIKLIGTIIPAFSRLPIEKISKLKLSVNHQPLNLLKIKRF